MNKKQLYESIMKNLQKELKIVLNEDEMSPTEKMDAWHNGEREENIKACGADKLKSYKAICKAKGYDAEVAALDAEIKKRGLKESTIVTAHTFEPEFDEVIEHVKNGTIDTEKDSEILFDALVPGSGNADNLGGELLRAAERIVYRYFNDGDKAGEGYGRETVNPAVRFMYDNVTPTTLNNPLWRIVKDFYKFVERSYVDVPDKEYEFMTMRLLRYTIIHVVENKLWEIPNDKDMWDWKNDKLDVDRDDDWEDDDY